MPRGPTKAITTEIGEELMGLYAQGYTDAELIKWLKNHHGIPMSVRGMNAYRQRQFEARSIASMRAVGPKVELVMGDEIDKLLRFKTFLEDNVMDIWRNIPKEHLHNPKVLLKFIDAYQKAQNQILMLHGIDLTTKAGVKMEDIQSRIAERLERLAEGPTESPTESPIEATNEDTQPDRENES